MFGTSSSKNKAAYSNPLLEKFWTNAKDRQSINTQVSHVYIAIDPSGGGKSSDTAISAGYYDTDGRLILLSMVNVRAKKPEDYLKVLDEMFKCIVKIPQCQFTKFIMILENNMGFEAAHIDNHVRKLPYNSVSIEGKDGKCGLHTSPAIKAQLHLSLEKAIESNAIMFSEHFFTVGDMNKLMYDFHDQLKSFKIIVEVNTKSVFARARTTFSGKSGGGKDDVVLVLQLLNFWSQEIVKRQRYRRFL